MTSQQFSKYLTDPGLVNDQSLQQFEEIVARYPYCQSAQLMLAFNLYAEETGHFPVQLKKAAAYAGDRAMLRELVGFAKTIHVVPSPKTEPPPEEPAQPLLQVFRETISGSEPEELPEIIKAPEETPLYEPLTPGELLTIVKNRLLEIEAEKYQEGGDENFNTATPNPGGSKTALIDKFIRDEPRISKPNTTFFNPSDSAMRSNFDEEEIVSETLAQLYAQQGNIQKAIHIYEKLSLLNQEKSRFFAAQIEKLNS